MRVIQRVEGVEEFFLHGFLAAQKLNVVHQQHINLTVLLAEFNHGFHLQRFHHFIDEIVDFDVADVLFGIVLFNFILNGKQKVGFAQAGVAV